MVRTALRLVLLTTLLAGPAAAGEAEDILQQATRAQYKGNAIQTLRLTATARSGRERTREIQLLVRRDGEEIRVRGELTAPDTLAGTCFVVVDSATLDPEILLFLPALGTVTPIRGERRGDAFLGTDFAFEDISPPDLEGGAHTLLAEDADSWTVESVPASGTSRYARVRAQLFKADLLPHRVEYFDADGRAVKRLELLEVGADGQPTKLRMTDLSRETFTVMEVLDQRLDVPSEELPLELFTRESLKKG